MEEEEGGRRREAGAGLRGLNREVCRAQLFPIQSGAVFANTLSAKREKKKKEKKERGGLTD